MSFRADEKLCVLQGMVLCASNDDHTVVQLVDAPAGSKPGDRVTFKGFDGEAATPAQVAKKKIFEKLAPEVLVVGFV